MPHRGTTPEIRTLLRDAERVGCTVIQGRKGHWKVIAPRGIVFVSLTPSTRGAAMRARADLRRAGAAV